MAIQVGQEGEATMAYDLDLCRILGAWAAKLPSSSASGPVATVNVDDPAFVTGDVAGYLLGEPAAGAAAAEGLPPAASPPDAPAAVDASPIAWHDPRTAKPGPLPQGHARCLGYCVNGSQTILKWDIGGTEVLELPAYDVVLNGGGYFTRTLQVAESRQAVRILVAGNPQPDGPINIPTHQRSAAEVPGLEGKERVLQSTPWVHGEHGEVMIWSAGDPDGSTWRLINGELALEVPPRAKAATFQIAYWIAPRDDPDGKGAPLFFQDPEVDLAALTRGAAWQALPSFSAP
jgi:hypothetical protein